MEFTFTGGAAQRLIDSVAAMRRAHEAYTQAMQDGSDAWADLFEDYRKACAVAGMALEDELKVLGVEVITYPDGV
jgi:hypothetical protein